eukprot:c8653_g1_i1.p1 GENE.c8653_g1_i1~~c8653_g1_i1.p1  ORF type:complete len:229 (+),score=46.75 c8653_g1_i1:314-1000(+)
MSINADRTIRALARIGDLQWVSSPSKGVWRKMIERVGDEVARATTIVRFEPNHSFPAHTHSGGEEFIVLEGVWRDDYGAFPTLSYVRNYINSSHSPKIGEEGCTILVKLRQMSHEIQEPPHRAWSINTSDGWTSDNQGRDTLELYSSKFERVFVEKWAPNTEITHQIPAHGEELFVLSGDLFEGEDALPQYSWLRSPNPGAVVQRRSGAQGALIWFKSGHLDSPEVGV